MRSVDKTQVAQRPVAQSLDGKRLLTIDQLGNFLAQFGNGKDDKLVFTNPEERKMLKDAGGKGTPHPLMPAIPEYDDSGDGGGGSGDGGDSGNSGGQDSGGRGDANGDGGDSSSGSNGQDSGGRGDTQGGNGIGGGGSSGVGEGGDDGTAEEGFGLPSLDDLGITDKDIGKAIGATLGSAFGPIGSALGGFLGGQIAGGSTSPGGVQSDQADSTPQGNGPAPGSVEGATTSSTGNTGTGIGGSGGGGDGHDKSTDSKETATNKETTTTTTPEAQATALQILFNTIIQQRDAQHAQALNSFNFFNQDKPGVPTTVQFYNNNPLTEIPNNPILTLLQQKR